MWTTWHVFVATNLLGVLPTVSVAADFGEVTTAFRTCPYIEPSRPGTPESLACADGFVWMLPRSCAPFEWYPPVKHVTHNPSLHMDVTTQVPFDCVFRGVHLARWPAIDAQTRRPAPVLLDVKNLPVDRSQPLVSALHAFVSTSADFLNARRKFITSSMAQWNAQRYGNLEYVIVYHRDDAETARLVSEIAAKFETPADTRRVTHVTVDDASMPLGKVRNIAVDAASGVYVVTWDDDNMMHPLRIASQVLALQCSGKKAVMLDDFTEHWTKAAGDQTFLSKRTGKIQTILAERSVMVNCYNPSLRVGEDVPCRVKLVTASPRITVLIHAPWLYVYVKHGSNVSPMSWFSRHRTSDARSSGANVTISEAVHRRLESSLEQILRTPHGGLDISTWPSTRELENTRCGDTATQSERERFWKESRAYFSP